MKERLLVTVKTYPTLSTKYAETVCTAGIREDGSWVRLYPVPFRRLQDYERFQKYQWLSVRLTPRTSDPRPESFSPDLDSIELEDVVPPSDDWSERCRLVLGKGAVYDDMNELIQLAKANQLSLATYKPHEILDVVVEQAEREWPEDRIKSIELAHSQGDLRVTDQKMVTMTLCLR